ncbi:ribonuclease R [Thermoclostridium stercorarium subsp. stercorarium DSM 8532]|uniref:Ribonuclease R n=1 Tax=Thermoclostridium stercorarium (strain ATCC 35414 / DSM 8532 / NCIMB 11754) TaxID=1121335 RepID=L7VJI5_THES1|nr:ribonuclease R [Thermoclostridium stercorarium]AGC68245.1 ribonuclease R [Thermoclostridium stercorarium subsp. stercorarium DSM 8532]AGI39272.1 ribonuclease R [Thermoclostridium stercorarium subsp. stercorarium DSM 8532]
MLEERKERIKGFIHDSSYHPLTFEELVVSLDVPKEDIELFRKCLDELEQEGHIYKTKKNRYVAPEKIGLVTGTFQGHERGFGFVLPDEPDQSDIFIQSDRVKGAMDGDRVIARIVKFYNDDRHSEGEIVKILSRANDKIVGTFEKSYSVGYVVPDHRRIKGHIIVPLDRSMGAKPHQKVVVQITRYPEPERNAEGQIIEILGDADTTDVEALSILKAYKIPVEFPDEVLQEARSIPQELTPKDYAGRRDLRNLTMVTIDGEDARDLDDAVSLEITGNGNYLLGVHIADVSHYVKENSPLDKEALKRGTSVYFPDRVIPMLPKELSNGICSLNPKVDRLAFSVFMEIDPLGRVINHEIVESVINVNERMTYTDVYKILEERDQDLIERYRPLVPMFEKMKELALILMKRRSLRGAIDFDFEETKITVDENGKPVNIGKYEITIANKIIEEFMLLCNETVSEHFYWADIPFVYRIHEDPDPDKIKRLNEFLFNFGVRIKGSGHVHPRALQDVLDKVKGTPQERIISTMMLRSLQKAKYSDEHTWHFGLAADYYSHFTSPIRRYPDLIIHRIMKEYLHGKFDEQRNEHYSAILPDVTKHCSERERSAEEAEREYEAKLKAVYMQEHIGETFTGIVSGITSFGMFVELENTVEGLIRLTSMDDDFYEYDEKMQVLIGVRTGRIYRIGDTVEVVVTNADPKTRQVDFVLTVNAREADPYAEDSNGNGMKKRGKSGKKKKNTDNKVLEHINGKKKKRKK